MKKGVVILIVCMAVLFAAVLAFEYSGSICFGEE